MTPDGLHGLEHVYLAVLDHLFDTRVRGTIHAAPASAVAEMTIRTGAVNKSSRLHGG